MNHLVRNDLLLYKNYFHNKNLQEGIDIEGDLDQLKKDSKLESKNFIKKQQTHKKPQNNT